MDIIHWISMTKSSRKDLKHLLFVGLTVSREEGGSVVWEGSTCQHIPRSWQFIMQSDDLFFKSEIFLDTIDFPNIRNFFVNGHQFFSQNIDKSKLISSKYFPPSPFFFFSIKKNFFYLLAVQDSSIGDIVSQWVSEWVTFDFS